MQYMLVGIGGALGSITRYSIGNFISNRFNQTFPLATFIINITGAVLLGLLSSIGVHSNLYSLFGDGFLGAYTTFSTFMYEGFNLFKGRKKLNAITYILSSLILGVIGYQLGFIIGRILFL